MTNYNGIGSEFIEGGIFERFSELTPYIDDNYYDNETHSQLLVIGESNYFNSKDAEISCFLNADDWYKNAPKELLIPNVLEKKVNNDGKITAPQLKGLYHTLTNVLNRKLKENDRYSDVAFYNYFLRPAYDDGQNNGFGKKGYYKDIDGEVAFSAFCGILKEIKPNLVIFATKIGFDKMEYFRKKTDTVFENIVIERVAHPSCRWWNVYGKQVFENYLCEYWLKEKPKYYLNFEKLQSIHKELKLMFFDKYVKEACYTEGDLSYSQLHFKIIDYTFCFQIEIKKEEAHYWSYFYPTNECKIINVNFKEEKYKYDFLSTDNNETIIAEIKKRIQQIINELSR